MGGREIVMKKLLFIALVAMAVVAPFASSVADADYAIDKTIQAP